MRLSASQIEAIKHKPEDVFTAQVGVRLFGLRMVNKQHGFTLVELVMTMVIIGILAAVVAPRFFDVNVFQERGAADQIRAALRYGQKIAVAQRRIVTVNISAAANSNCSTELDAFGAVNCVISDRVAVVPPLPLVVTFTGLGQPNAPASVLVGGTTNITVAAETGYVH
jgi:MSHA pilin protein MshC